MRSTGRAAFYPEEPLAFELTLFVNLIYLMLLPHNFYCYKMCVAVTRETGVDKPGKNKKKNQT